MSDMVKHHSGNWEGVKGPPDQWLTVLVKATCAEPTKTSNDCSSLKRHKNKKSHPEKMVRNGVEVHETAEAGSQTDARTHTISHPGANWTLMICKGSTWIMQAAVTNHMVRKTKQKKQVSKASAETGYIPLCPMLESNTPLQVAFIASLVNKKFPAPVSAYCLLCNSPACNFAHVRTWGQI